MMTNRLLRFTQRPANIFHASVFHQFSGGLGPSGVAVSKNGTIFVSHFDFAEGEGKRIPGVDRPLYK